MKRRIRKYRKQILAIALLRAPFSGAFTGPHGVGMTYHRSSDEFPRE